MVGYQSLSYRQLWIIIVDGQIYNYNMDVMKIFGHYVVIVPSPLLLGHLTLYNMLLPSYQPDVQLISQKTLDLKKTLLFLITSNHF